MMMTISFKLVIYQKGFILDRVTKKIVMSGSTDVRLNRCIIFCLYQNKLYEKIKLYFILKIHQHVQNKSYEESN